VANHILGNTSAPSAGGNDTSGDNEIAPTGFVTLPANGYITKLWGYFGSTSGGAMAATLILFDQTLTIRTTASPATVYGQSWQGVGIAPYSLASGSQMGVGWYVNAEVHFSVYSSGQWRGGHVGGASNAGGFAIPGYPFFQGGTGYYVEWIDALTVSGVSPSTAASGASVTISGVGFTGGALTGVSFNGIPASYSVLSDTAISATVPHGASGGTLSVSSDHGSGSTTFTLAAPTISSLSPTSAIAGTTVTLTGFGFTDGSVSAVSFNGIAATSFAVQSNTQLTAVVPNGYTTGALTVTTGAGTGSIAFTEGPPTISGVSPTSAGVGQLVTLTGAGFTDGTVSGVTFTPAGGSPISASYTVVSNTSLTTTVPAGASGADTITVTSNHGSASIGLLVSGAHAFDGTALQNATPYAYDGTTTQIGNFFAYDGTTWQQAQ
jgi:hypothetical protein